MSSRPYRRAKGWHTPQVEGEPGEGKEVTFRFTDGEPFRWRFAKLSPDTRVDWECLGGPGAAVGTKVTFCLTKTPDGETLVNATTRVGP